MTDFIENKSNVESSVENDGKKRRRKKVDGSKIEEHVGKKIKLFRQMLGMSQANVAKYLDITFQQFQKYETGKNRIPISKLMKLAEIFGINVSVFFENSFNVQFDDRSNSYSALKEGALDIEMNKPTTTVTSIKSAATANYQEDQISSLMKSFQSIKDIDTKRHIAMLIQNLSDDQKS